MAQQDARRDCVWFEDGEGIYETECGKTFEFTTGGASENGFVYCPYCARVLRDKILEVIAGNRAY